MSVGILILELQIPGCKSLKEKRSRIKPLITRLHREFNISVAELDRLDTWDETIIGCAMISNDHQFVNTSLGVIIHWLERNWPDVTLVDNHIEIIT
jgi:uncharacterized protein